MIQAVNQVETTSKELDGISKNIRAETKDAASCNLYQREY